MALFGNHHYNDFDDDEICSGKYKCPECGWVGDEKDLVNTNEENNICPRCLEWYNIIVLPDKVEENEWI